MGDCDGQQSTGISSIINIVSVLIERQRASGVVGKTTDSSVVALTLTQTPL